MRETTSGIYRCPYTREPLTLRDAQRDGDTIVSGTLVAPSGQVFPIRYGVPHLVDVSSEAFGDEERREYEFYEATSELYDPAMDWMFESFGVREDDVRGTFVAALDLQPSSKVLDIGGGTGRDSIRFARKLGPDGQLFLQDLSPAMLMAGKRRLEAEARPDGPLLEAFVGNVAHLPFPDGYFDAVFHFGAFNIFTDRKAALMEMTRVVRPGGKVAFGDEGLGPWLRDTTYGKILLNSHPMYDYRIELELLPESARDVHVQWLIGNAFFLVDFVVGEGTPYVNLDLPILGRRGGTHRTRYFGRLEGVTPETKALMEKAAAASGLSLHAWMEQVVGETARKQLGE